MPSNAGIQSFTAALINNITNLSTFSRVSEQKACFCLQIYYICVAYEKS